MALLPNLGILLHSLPLATAFARKSPRLMRSLPTDARERKSLGEASPAPAVAKIYDRTFWLCFAANCCLMAAVSLLFRYADYVRHLGGSEMDLGLIVGVGMVGALATRILQGLGIDRLGARRIWQFSLVLFAASALAHLGVSRADGVGIYVVRILLTTSTASAFGSALTYVSLRAPAHRMGEIIGMVGTSGFFGIALGPTLGDLVFAMSSGEQALVRMFCAAAGLSLVALVIISFTSASRPVPLRRRVPVVALIGRYHPGVIWLTALATGLVLGLPHTFLNAYTYELGIAGIRVFFLVYAVSALIVRLSTRRMTDVLGVRPAILWGLGSAILSMVLYLVVRTEWSLALPAVFAGAAHALMFPAVVTGGNRAFPQRYRGVSTALTLAMFDLGNLVGQPAMGGTVELARQFGLPAYPLLFTGVALVLLVIGGIFWLCFQPPSPAISELPNRRRKSPRLGWPAAPRPPRTAVRHTPSYEACPPDPRS